MKRVVPAVAIFLLATIVTSCSTSNDVVGGVFQKRKYNKGFYWNRSGKISSADENNVAEQKKEETIRLSNEETVAALDKKEVVATAETKIQPASYNHVKSVPVDEKETATVVKERRQAPTQPETKKEETKPVTVLKKNKSVKDVLRKKDFQDSHGQDDAMFILAVIFAILIPPIGVLIYTNIDWMKVLICLLLTILFFIPGMVYALLVVFDVI